jgi:hypothetical protein
MVLAEMTDQSILKSYDILFCDLAHGFICSPTEKLEKLVQTSLVKSMVDRAVSARLAVLGIC